MSIHDSHDHYNFVKYELKSEALRSIRFFPLVGIAFLLIRQTLRIILKSLLTMLEKMFLSWNLCRNPLDFHFRSHPKTKEFPFLTVLIVELGAFAARCMGRSLNSRWSVFGKAQRPQASVQGQDAGPARVLAVFAAGVLGTESTCLPEFARTRAFPTTPLSANCLCRRSSSTSRMFDAEVRCVVFKWSRFVSRRN